MDDTYGTGLYCASVMSLVDDVCRCGYTPEREWMYHIACSIVYALGSCLGLTSSAD